MHATISLCNAHVQLSELEAKGKVLPASSSDYKVVQKIADRVIKAVEAGRGGGFQDHVSKCALPVLWSCGVLPCQEHLPGHSTALHGSLLFAMTTVPLAFYSASSVQAPGNACTAPSMKLDAPCAVCTAVVVGNSLSWPAAAQQGVQDMRVRVQVPLGGCGGGRQDAQRLRAAGRQDCGLHRHATGPWSTPHGTCLLCMQDTQQACTAWEQPESALLRASQYHAAPSADQHAPPRAPGLIKVLDRDEDLLAAVLGHEVAHALARHSSEKLTCAGPFTP